MDKKYKTAIAAYHQNEEFSDFTIICGTTGKEYKVHRLLVSLQSRWFHRCCSRDFAEARESRTTLRDDVPEALDRM